MVAELITVTRLITAGEATLGRVLINGVASCWSLEDKVRDDKIMGKTAIPAGLYSVILRTEGGMNSRYNARFRENHQGMLWLYNVPEYRYIYLHIGNTIKDTSGCILLGDDFIHTARSIRLTNSTKAYKNFYWEVADSARRSDLMIRINDIPFTR